MKRKYQALWTSLTYISFSIYFALLMHLLFFQRMPVGGSHFAARAVNLIPFQTIRIFTSVPMGWFEWGNILGNILLFAPFGLYCCVTISGKRIRTYALLLLLFTVSVEILQWILAVGVTDIDDIMLNWLGGMLGLAAYRILLALFREEYRTKVFTAIFSNAIGIPILSIVVATYLHNR